jgi:hypothetical protein
MKQFILLCVLGAVVWAGSAGAGSAGAQANPVFVGAGDIARCGSGGPADSRPEATAKLLDTIAGTIFTAGDNAYPDGTVEDFQSCYAPTWGRHRARTRPSPGNHDYNQTDAAPYYAYFGTNAGPAGRGYYSYNLGAWHIISLNSNIPADTASPQASWLRTDLATHQAACTLAYWHHPLFSSGDHGNDPHMLDIWRILYTYGADVVISGHDHDYERFAPQTPDAEADPAHGIREFVVGTGGASLRAFRSTPEPNSEVRERSTYGVLKMTLRPSGYDWEFVPIAGQTFRDVGSAACVAPEQSPFFLAYLPLLRR